ncbi:MAG: response regulator [Bacteroidota bacterium]
MAKTKPRLLIIDDDEVNNFILLRLIREEKINVSCAAVSNGKRGLKRLLNLHDKKDNGFPDVILLDLDMPGMDGFEFLDEYEKELYPHHPEVQLYMVSSSIRTEDRTRAKSYASVSNFISKPISVMAIKQFVAQSNFVKTSNRL